MSTSYYNIALSSIDSNGNPCIVYPKTKASNVIMDNGSNIEAKFNSIDSSISSINSNIRSTQDQEVCPFIVKDTCTSVLYYIMARDMSNGTSTYYNICKNANGDAIFLTHDDIGKFIYVPTPIVQNSSMAPQTTPAGFYKITKTNILVTSGSLAGKYPATFGKCGAGTGILKTGSFGNDPLYSISQLTSLVNELNGEVVKIENDSSGSVSCSHAYSQLYDLLYNRKYIRNVVYEDELDHIEVQHGSIVLDSGGYGAYIYISFFEYNGPNGLPILERYRIDKNNDISSSWKEIELI